jgi:hypothetical protein
MTRTLFTTLIATLTLAAPAMAQDPVRDAYGGAGNVASETAESAGPGGGGVRGVATEGAGPGGGVTEQAVARPLGGDELPFTGLDVGLIAVGGIVLLALGFGVRRVSRQPAA